MQHASDNKTKFDIMFEKLKKNTDVGNLLAEVINIGDQFTNENF